jgi:hypothetical protein
MHLMLSPMRGLPGQKETAILVSGDTVTVDGVAFDLSPVPEGGLAEPEGEHPFVGLITREGGVIHATVRVMLDDSAAPHQPSDPAHWILEGAEGPVQLPISRIPEPEKEDEV